MKGMIFKRYPAGAAMLLFVVVFLAGCTGKRGTDMVLAQTGPRARLLISNTGNFQAENLDGTKIGKEVFAGHKLTMFNVWATWCGPCLQEMPDLEKVSRTRQKDGVQIIGVVLDTTTNAGSRDPEKIELTKKILARTGVNYRIIQPDRVLNEGLLRGIQAIPTTFFIDADGRIIGEPVVGSRPEAEWNRIITDRLRGI